MFRVTQWDLGHFGVHQCQGPAGQGGEERLEPSLFLHTEPCTLPGLGVSDAHRFKETE